GGSRDTYAASNGVTCVTEPESGRHRRLCAQEKAYRHVRAWIRRVRCLWVGQAAVAAVGADRVVDGQRSRGIGDGALSLSCRSRHGMEQDCSRGWEPFTDMARRLDWVRVWGSVISVGLGAALACW